MFTPYSSSTHRASIEYLENNTKSTTGPNSFDNILDGNKGIRFAAHRFGGKKGPLKIFPEIYDKTTGFRVGRSFGPKSRGPGKLTLVLPPMKAVSASITPAKTGEYVQMDEGQGKHKYFLSTVDPESDEFERDLYGNAYRALTSLYKLYNNDLIEFLATGKDSDGNDVLPQIDELSYIWDNNDGDPDKIRSELNYEWKNKNSDLLRDCAAHKFKADVLEMDWDARNKAVDQRGPVPQSVHSKLKEWRDTFTDADNVAHIDYIESKIESQWTSKTPRVFSNDFMLFDSDGKPVSMAEAYKNKLEFKDAIITVTLNLGAVRILEVANKLQVMNDIHPTGIQINRNGQSYDSASVDYTSTRGAFAVDNDETGNVSAGDAPSSLKKPLSSPLKKQSSSPLKKPSSSQKYEDEDEVPTQPLDDETNVVEETPEPESPKRKAGEEEDELSLVSTPKRTKTKSKLKSRKFKKNE